MNAVQDGLLVALQNQGVDGLTSPRGRLKKLVRLASVDELKVDKTYFGKNTFSTI